MKKKYENFWNMYSNCFNTIEAFAQKKSPIAPQKIICYVKIIYFTQFTVYINSNLQLDSNSTLKVLPVKVEQDHVEYGKKEA